MSWPTATSRTGPLRAITRNSACGWPSISKRRWIAAFLNPQNKLLERRNGIMKRGLIALATALGLVGGAWQMSSAHGPHHAQPVTAPPCEPGYQMVQVTEMQTVERTVCKIVPETKQIKKWV